MDRNLALELVRVTEAAALASARWMGKGDAEAAYEAARDAVALAMKSIQVLGSVNVGTAGAQIEASEGTPPQNAVNVDVIVEPLHSTRSVAFGLPNAISVVAVANKGAFFESPVPYAEAILVGDAAQGRIDIEASPLDNMVNVADAKRCYVEDLTVSVLDREWNRGLVDAIRDTGARIQLIGEGDVAAAIGASVPGSGVDVVMGVMGSVEMLLATAAVKCAGGDVQGRLFVRNDNDATALEKAGLRAGTVLSCDDLISGPDTMFAATGVTSSEVLRGVQFEPGGATTHSIVMRNRSGTIRFIETNHRFDMKPVYK